MGSIDRNLRTGEVECTDETFHLYGVDRASFEPTTEDFVRLCMRTTASGSAQRPS